MLHHTCEWRKLTLRSTNLQGIGRAAGSLSKGENKLREEYIEYSAGNSSLTQPVILQCPMSQLEHHATRQEQPNLILRTTLFLIVSQTCMHLQPGTPSVLHKKEPPRIADAEPYDPGYATLCV